jgi:hypothetical protein
VVGNGWIREFGHDVEEDDKDLKGLDMFVVDGSGVGLL